MIEIEYFDDVGVYDVGGDLCFMGELLLMGVIVFVVG